MYVANVIDNQDRCPKFAIFENVPERSSRHSARPQLLEKKRILKIGLQIRSYGQGPFVLIGQFSQLAKETRFASLGG